MKLLAIGLGLVLLPVQLPARETVGRIEVKTIEHYPFVATAARREQILAGYLQVKPGMSVAEVTTLLGEADETRELFTPQAKKAKLAGHTRWYVLQRLVANGSVSEKQEALVRVSFDLQQQVTAVDAWGF